MASFREQMQRLVDGISRTRSERKAFVAQNQKLCGKMRIDVSSQREQTKRELAKSAKTLGKSLASFNRNNQKAVASSLRNTRQSRLAQARALKSSLGQEASKNRRNIARLLRQNNSDRKRQHRQQLRETATVLQSVKQQVHRIRIATNRMTRSWANDRLEAKRLWLQLQSTQTGVRNFERPMVAPEVVSRPDSLMRSNPIAPSVSNGLTGLAMPPMALPSSVS